MVVIDIIFLGLIILLVVRAFIRGFVSEFFSLGAPALGILGGVLFHKNGADFLRAKLFNNMDMKVIPEILAFIAIFLIGFVICKIVQKIIHDVVSGTNLTTMDKVLGALFGLLEGLLLISLVLFLITVQPLFDPAKALQGSFFAGFLLPLVMRTSSEVMRNSGLFIFTSEFKLG